MVDALGPAKVGPIQRVKQTVKSKDEAGKRPGNRDHNTKDSADSDTASSRKGKRIDDHA